MAFFMSPTYEKMVRKYSGQPEPIVESAEQSGKNDSLKEKTPEKTVLANTVTEEVGDRKILDSNMAHSDSPDREIGDTLWIETEKIIAGITEVGARVVSLKMKEYQIDHTKSDETKKCDSGCVELVSPGSEGGGGIQINTESFDRRLFTIQQERRKIKISGNEARRVTFLYTDSLQGMEIEKVFIFSGSSYRIGLNIKSNRLNSNRLTISWLSGINECEKNKIGMYQTEERKVSYSDGSSVGHIKAMKLPPTDFENPPSGSHRWIGVSSKYFFIGLVAEDTKNADLKVNAFEDKKIEGKDGKKDKVKRINYSISFQYSVEGDSASFWIYTGPSKYEELKKYKVEFEQILFPVLSWARHIFWADNWFPPLAELVLWLLLLFYSLVKDYGVAIIILTILSRVVTFPLTQSSMKSMTRMKDLQPKINAIRQKHKSNPKKMNEEIMALYKAEGVNPLNPGCLPMFLQMPVFISLFIVLQRAIELRGAATVIVPWISDLSKPEAIFFLPGDGVPLYGNNFAILPIIMAVLTYFQNKMTIKDPNQKMMIYFMPIFMMVIFNAFPSGLVLYWTVSSGLGLVQQMYLEHKKKKEPLPEPQKTEVVRNRKKR